MIDISVNNLVKSFEIGSNVLDGLSFTVQAGERVGILGHNGCGKTTLFRILVGELRADEGEISIAPSKRLGLISQIPVYPAGWTTDMVLRDAHRRLYAISDRIDELTAQMETDQSPALLREYDRLQEDFRRLGGYEMDVERSRVANGLDIPPAMLDQEFASLSGGEKTRVNLARLILEDTDILLLDEPTNHLDLHATEWLEDYLLRFKGTVLAVSHDRYFLDRIVQRSIEIADGKAEFYSGNYSFYVEERQRRFEEKLKQYEKDQAKIEQLTRAAEQMHLWAFMGNDKLHKRAFSMEKRIEKLSRTERPTEQKKLKAKFKEREFYGDEVLVMDSIAKGYGRRTLFSDLDLLVTGGERIALIGDNGTGKSTLVKLIMNEEKPDAGFLYLGPTVRRAYLPQLVSFTDETRSALDTMLYDCRCTPQEARDRLAAFGFRGEDVFTPVGALSGGEKSRLRLCMLMGGDVNFLILDEPTNHLDIASREWMEDALSDYEQTLLFVSHDRYFIEKFATRIWALHDGTITDFRGGYREYCAWRDRQAAREQSERQREKEQKKEPKTRPQRPKNNDKALQRLEREIGKLEEKIAALDALAEEHAADYQKLMELGAEKERLEAELLALYERWEELDA
ncbi:MAG: ABC-F family ATP-binding cassette domain-containing protein [Oscillospiraceae bacterium]|nr:ABC-F family ATP-binding cassette domain-containing protein [Oscillospiraceae bacterium]